MAFLNREFCGLSFEQFKTLAMNSRLPQELQELTTVCTIQLRTSWTEYDSLMQILKFINSWQFVGFVFCVE